MSHVYRYETQGVSRQAVLFALGILLLFTGVSWAGGFPVRVAVSIAPQAYFVNQIGGERVHVVVLLPPGANPETFEPKAQTLLSLARAKLYFRIHVPFEEAWMKKFQAVNRKMRAIDTTKGIAVVHGDPHIWLAPSLVERQARTICDAVETLDPSGKEEYERNFGRFKQRLTELKRKINKRFKNLKRRVFLAYHPCWGYFAREFGLTQMAIEQGGKAPGAAALSEITKAARLHGIHCVFAQPQFDTRSAGIIAGQIHGRLVLIDPLARNWDENLLKVTEKIARCLER